MYNANKIILLDWYNFKVLCYTLHILSSPLFSFIVSDARHPQPWALPASSACRHLHHVIDMSECINTDAIRSKLVASPRPHQCRATQPGPCAWDHLRPCTPICCARAPAPQHATPSHATPPATPLLWLRLLNVNDTHASTKLVVQIWNPLFTIDVDDVVIH